MGKRHHVYKQKQGFDIYWHKQIQTINDELDITDPVKVAKRHPHANFSIHGEKDKDDSKDTESANGKNKPLCLICSGSHRTAFCGKLDKKETDHKKRRDVIRSKKLCLKCLCTWTTEHVCLKDYTIPIELLSVLFLKIIFTQHFRA